MQQPEQTFYFASVKYNLHKAMMMSRYNRTQFYIFCLVFNGGL